VLLSLVHSIEYLLDKVRGYILMKKVAHRIDEYHLGLFPLPRQIKNVRMTGQLEAVSVVRLAHRLQSFRHSLGVAVLTAAAYLRATGYRIPRRFGPFNR